MAGLINEEKTHADMHQTLVRCRRFVEGFKVRKIGREWPALGLLVPGLLERIDAVLDDTPELQLIQERDNWISTARMHSNNEEFWRDLVYETAKHLGPDVYVSDDGSVQDTPLGLKVPEMVKKLKEDSERWQIICQEYQDERDLSKRWSAKWKATAKRWKRAHEVASIFWIAEADLLKTVSQRLNEVRAEKNKLWKLLLSSEESNE